MKFLCPSCKAKYQIADEKVAGRSVRMKCRKCGFVIPLSEVPPAPESVLPEGGGTEPLPVVPKAPRAPSQVDAEEAKPQSPAGPGVAAKLPAVAAKPGLPRPPTAEIKSSPRPAGAAPVTASVAAKPKPAAPAATGAAPVRPGLGSLLTKPGAFPAQPKPGAVSGVPKPALSAAPKPSTPAAPPAAGSSPVAAPAVTAPKPAVVPSHVEVSQALLGAVEDDDDDDNTRMVSGGALAAAFGALVGAGEAGAVAAASSDEWFVGINEVPVGPIRLAELRKRAILGAVTLESMVWRDGLEAWRPLKTFPELVAVLEESFSNVRASRAPLTPPQLGDASAGALLANGGVQTTQLSPATTTGQAVVTDDLAAAGLPRGRTPLGAWLAIVVALAFGLVLGFVFFSSQKPAETVVKIVEVPAKSGEVPVAAAPPPPETAGSAVVADVTKPKTGGTKSGGTKTAEPANTADKGGGLTGLKGLGGLNPATPGGPGAPGPGGATPGGGGQLDAGQIQATVGRYTGSVKRSCWQPALDARDANSPTSARVMVTITVGASGSVQNVSTSGEPRGYPGLAGCIAGRVRAWQFPATGGTTTVNVPFVFAAQ